MNYKTLLLLSLGAFAFTACGDDDEAQTPEQLLVGTWEVSQIEDDNSQLVAVTVDDCESDDVIEFREGGIYAYDYNDDTQCLGSADEAPGTGTYTVQGNIVTITEDGISLPSTFTVTESTLLLDNAFLGRIQYARQ